jgi:hypothetical protein
MSLQQQNGGTDKWFLDTGMTSHMSMDPGNLSSCTPHHTSSRVIVGNGASLPITHIGFSSIPTSSTPLQFYSVLVTPHLIKNLASVRCLTHDNPITIEFDALGFSIMDFHTRAVILGCDSTSDPNPLSSGTRHLSLHAGTST